MEIEREPKDGRPNAIYYDEDAHSMNTKHAASSHVFAEALGGTPSRVSPGNLHTHVHTSVGRRVVEASSMINKTDWTMVSIRSYHPTV